MFINIHRQFFSLILSFLMVSYDLCWALELKAPLSSGTGISRKYGQTIEVYSPAQKQPIKKIYLIKDPHANFSGQESILKIVEGLTNDEKISTVFVEGAWSDVSLGALRGFISRQEAKNFLRQGLISGEEYYSLVSKNPIRLIGMEKLSLYARARYLYQRTLLQREEFLERVKGSRRALEALKRRYYPGRS